MRATLVAALLLGACQYDASLGADDAAPIAIADSARPPDVDGAFAASDGFACLGFYDTNYNHVLAGRAYRCGVGGSYVCAVGSGINFGLWTVTLSWLRETGPAYYEPGPCP